MEEEQNSNPFAAPAVVGSTAIPDFDPDREVKEYNLGRSIGRWLLVCFVSAAPSFYFGSILSREYATQSAAMVLGILTFVAFYVFIESLEWTRRKLMSRPLRVAVWIGYATRVGISVIFPIAIFVDVFCGIIAISFTSTLFGVDFSPGRVDDATNSVALIFLWFYITTLVQGVILNGVLGAYTLVVFAFALLFRKPSLEK